MTSNGDAPVPSVVVGLGNPGPLYAGNRHNAGFMTIDALAHDAGLTAWHLRWRSLAMQASIDGRQVLLAKPQTYMNASGNAVAAIATDLGVGPGDFLIIYDDISLPFGRIRVRPRGSAGGHRGIESIIAALSTEEIPRIRLGVGEENMPEDKAGFVLSDFPPEKGTVVQELVNNAAAAARMVLREGICRAMAAFNG